MMDLFISWLIKSFVTSGILYLYYQVVLRNKQFHSYNRFYLLGTVVLSMLAPFIHFRWLEIKTQQGQALNFFLNTMYPSSTRLVVLSCAGVVSTVLLAILFSKVIWVFKIKANGMPTKMQGFNFIETTASQAPFSFLNNLFWKKGMSINDNANEKIFAHEMVHIQQGHTYDKLFSQLVACMFWINPFYWLIQKELNIVHEFLADEKCIAHGDAESFAVMLLSVHNNGSYLNPSHPFFNSSVKRRLMMITSSKNSRYANAKKITAVPLVLLLVLALSANVKAKAGSELITGARQVNQPAQLQKQHAEKLAAEKAALR